MNNGIWIMYLRKSRQDDPNETVAEVLQKHERQLQDFAEQKLGYRIDEQNIYREIGSGESIAERTEIKKVLARLEDPAVAGCIVIEPSRLSRGDLSDCAKIIDSFKYTKSLVLTPMMQYDLNDKMQKKYFQDELLRGNDYLEYVKGILWRGRMQSVQGNGAFIGRIAPYGYKKIKVGKIPTLEIVEDEAEIVRLVFDLYIKGTTPYFIAKKLNDMGVKSPTGGEWVKDTIRQMIRNPHYAGYVRFNHRKTQQFLVNGEIVKKRITQDEENWIVVEGKHQPIIDRETWEQAKKLVARNPRLNHIHDLRNPFSGLVFCKGCGHAMRFHPYKHAEDRMVCKTRPPCYKSVKYCNFFDAVIYALEQSELPALELKLTNGDGNAVEIQRKQLVKLEKQMEEYKAQEDKQFELLETNPNYTQEVFNRRHAELRAKMDECQSAIYKTKSTLPESVDFAERIDTLKNAIDILKDDNATAAEKNKILKAIIERIEYSGLPAGTERGGGRYDTKIDPFTLDITLKL